MIGLVDVYRVIGAPIAAMLGARCRFHPSCSAYAREALAELPLPRAFSLIAGRLLRCHPWCEGGVDPVPSLDMRRRRRESEPERI